MSYCREEGKDKIIFVTKEDYEKPSTALVTTKNDDEDDEEPGLIFKDGSINWNCPCLGGMAAGPCGVPFRDAFSCFHYSEAAPKGSDCFDSFKKMQDCMSGYPELYPSNDESKDPLADAPDQPEEKLESSSSEPITGTGSSSEAAPTESAPEKQEEKIVLESSSSEPATEVDSSSEVIPSVSTELAPDQQEEKIVLENSSSEPAVEADSSSEVIHPEAASTEQNTAEEKS